jgi:hypothetical protein
MFKVFVQVPWPTHWFGLPGRIWRLTQYPCGKTAMSSSEQMVEQLALWAIHGHELQWVRSSARAMDTLTALKPTL